MAGVFIRLAEEQDTPEAIEGGKRWNPEQGNWELDGNPVSYRVTWKSVDDGIDHATEFPDIDQGYSFYEQMQKSANAYRVTWDHIPW